MNDNYGSPDWNAPKQEVIANFGGDSLSDSIMGRPYSTGEIADPKWGGHSPLYVLIQKYLAKGMPYETAYECAQQDLANEL